MQSILVKQNEAGQRLDKMLAKYLNLAPKSFIYKMLRKKNITLNGKKADGSEKLNVGDEVKLFLADETIEKFSEVKITVIDKPKLDVIYENKHVLIINKPQGMLSQKAKDSDVSLNEHIISYMLQKQEITNEQLKSFKPAVCNRLDRNTSGIVIAGKTLLGLQEMSKLLHNRDLGKYYICIVSGKITDKKLIEGYLLKDEATNKVSVFEKQVDGADYIKTEYTPLESNDEYTVLEVKLHTGRSHQIRAHLASIGHPIIGDYKYGNSKINEKYKKQDRITSQMLHSYRLELPVMSDELSDMSQMVIKAKLPQKYRTFVKGDLF